MGYSRRFNVCDRIVSFHSMAPAALFPSKPAAFAVLAHNLNHDPFENKEAAGKLKKLGLLPAPVPSEES